ncbi:MAG: Structural maintenance of chromosomes protein 1B [Paramarteilia canceri]
METEGWLSGETGVLLAGVSVNSFKSYSKPALVAPLSPFCAAVGPNGSGKSNLSDAIRFALGEKPHHLRVARLADLISNLQIESNNQITSVTLFINNAGTIQQFKREISSSFTSVYSIDGEIMQNKEYLAELAKVGLSLRSSSFIVYQGTVESIAIKSPKELSQLFEEQSGSAKLAPIYNEYKINLEKLDSYFKNLLSSRKKLYADQKAIDSAKDDFKKYQELKKSMNLLKIKSVLLDVYKHDMEIDDIVKDIDQNKREFNSVENDLNEMQSQLNALHTDNTEFFNDNQELDTKLSKMVLLNIIENTLF